MRFNRRQNAFEYQFQCAAVQYLRYSGFLVFAVPNGGSRNVIEAARLKKAGVLAGAPDLVVISKRGQIDFIELKTNKGALSKNQNIFAKECWDRGANYYIMRNMNEVEEYINQKSALKVKIGGTD
jgi:hypothetical protein